ncbi:MAG: DUF3006 domain-containing protein [Firmicutes bacterium]|jgi:hypothetical protein|nr:DUF3006 domain-containing protein [Bacillota bacterium]MDD4337217.1 DUF3006 domain-containing protein [Bacillota bacterium]MDD4792160.1 DUF3006 domain-containing protein [Bacillota bacterium]
MKFLATLDRIEGELAVLLVRPDESIQILWPICALPEDVVEGAILDISVQVSEAETAAATERVQSLLDKLLGRGAEQSESETEY